MIFNFAKTGTVVSYIDSRRSARSANGQLMKCDKCGRRCQTIRLGATEPVREAILRSLNVQMFGPDSLTFGRVNLSFGQCEGRYRRLDVESG
jgi:hypothetical protein